jgi:hypothetical protein
MAFRWVCEEIITMMFAQREIGRMMLEETSQASVRALHGR